MKKAIITGADGFVGKHLTQELLKRKVEVFAICFLNSNCYKSVNSEYLHVIYIDLLKNDFDSSKFDSNIDTMFHFAWNGVKPEDRNLYDIQFSNFEITIKSLQLAQQLRVKKIIFPGSTNEYLYYGKPIDENATPTPYDAYGYIKTSLRYLCNSYCIDNGIKFVYTIIAGIYSSDRKDNNVITYTIKKLLKGETPEYTKLDQLWDYIY